MTDDRGLLARLDAWRAKQAGVPILRTWVYVAGTSLLMALLAFGLVANPPGEEFEGAAATPEEPDDWERPEVVMELDEERGLPNESVLELNASETDMGDADALVVEVSGWEHEYRPGEPGRHWTAFGPVEPYGWVRVWVVREIDGETWRSLVWERYVESPGRFALEGVEPYPGGPAE